MSDANRLRATSEDVEAMREWLRRQPHLPDFVEELTLKRFLYCCDHSLQLTKQTIDHYFTLRHRGPEIFANRDPLSEEIKQIYTVCDFLPLPKPTKDNYTLYLNRLIDRDPEHFFYNNSIKAFFMMADVRIATEEPLSAGDIPIFDMAGLSLKFLTRLVLPTLKKYMVYTQEAHPVKLKQIHVINCQPFVDKLFQVVKPFTKSDVMQMVHFHQLGSDTLYEHFPRDLLPEEYGGAAGPIAAIKERWIKRVDDYRDNFLNEKLWAVDESKRPADSESRGYGEVLDADGSFRALAID